MEEVMKELGNRIKCMEVENIVGLMGENMKENILMIKNKVMEHIVGMMEKSMLDIG